MYYNPDKYAEIPIGVVLRRTTGVTRWVKWAWRAVGILPHAGPAEWRIIRQDGDAVEYHAETKILQLHGSDAEAYLHGLSAQVPSVYVVMRNTGDPDRPLAVVLVTASPYEAQDYADAGEEVVERIAMPEGLAAWVRDFALVHYEEETFKKRKRDKTGVDQVEDGKGDARIRQSADVFRTPSSIRKERLN